MEDFSVLGFRVADCERAREVLRGSCFELRQSQGGTQVMIDNASQLEDVMRVLRASGLACELTDVAQGMYQG